MSGALKQVGAGVRALLVLTLALGVLYPLAVTGLAQVAAPGQADGSRVALDGTEVGSSLIGQAFPGPQWFHPRPSAAGDGYDPTASSASNLGPSNDKLVRSIETRLARLGSATPADALTASGSGLDPHITPENARSQIARVAEARGMDPLDLAGLVDEATQGRTLGFLGEDRVNVLELNIALEELEG